MLLKEALISRVVLLSAARGNCDHDNDTQAALRKRLPPVREWGASDLETHAAFHLSRQAPLSLNTS